MSVSVPLEAPSELTLVNFNDFDQVTVSWKAVDPETVRGHFRGYKVILSGSGTEIIRFLSPPEDSIYLKFKVVYWITEKPYFTDSVEVGAQELEAQLKNLKALTNYTVEVRAINQDYEGPGSLTISFSTPEGRKLPVLSTYLKL